MVPATSWRAASPTSLASRAWRRSLVGPMRHRPLLVGAQSGPGRVSDVIEWAEEAFRQEVAGSGEPNLAKACMLLSLEEEAAAQAMYLLAEGVLPSAQVTPRNATSAATWSLERLDSLAAQIAHLFYQRCQELGVIDELQAAAEEGAPDSQLVQLHAQLVRHYPMQLLGAVNEVVFKQQGYSKMRRHGDPRDSTLSAVLETGSGSPAALAVLYREVCARLGLPLQTAVLEDGQYLLLWPADEGVRLGVSGARFVIDPYAQGALFSMDEVCMLFDLDPDASSGLAPASGRDILAALLKGLQDAHWCRSVGCSPEPALMVPLTLELALGTDNPGGSTGSHSSSNSSNTDAVEECAPGQAADPLEQPGGDLAANSEGGSEGGTASQSEEQQHSGRDGGDEPAQPQVPGPAPGRRRAQQQQGWPAEGYHLERALAAAGKRALLLPHSRSARLQHALLLFFAKHYGAARREVDALLRPSSSSGSPPAAEQAASGSSKAQEVGPAGGAAPHAAPCSGFEEAGAGWEGGEGTHLSDLERLRLLRAKCRLLEGV